MCKNCPRMIKTKSMSSHSRPFELKLRGHFDCKSTYVIYLIECKRCKIQYIGQTSSSVASCLTAHIADINSTNTKKQETSVSKHFNEANHTARDVRVCALLKASRNVNMRMHQEEAMIQLFSTRHPRGLNIMT